MKHENTKNQQDKETKINSQNYFFVILVSVLSKKQIRRNKTKDLVLRETQL